MSFTRSEQLLLDTLRALPPQTVYGDADRKAVIRGFQLFIDHRVGHLTWEDDAVLVVRMNARGSNVIDLIPVAVRIFLENQDLRIVCSCNRTDRQERCEHVVCALVTLLHLLKPNLFKMTRENPAHRTQLEAGLCKLPSRSVTHPDTRVPGRRERFEAPVRVARKFQVVMEADGGSLRAFVEVNGKRIDEGFDFLGVPWEIAYLARSSYQHDMSYALSVFLKRTDNLYPLFYQEGSDRREVKWLGERRCPTWTELDAWGEEIIARKACSLNEEGEDHWTVIGNFAINGSRSALTRITPRTGWHYWDMLRAYCMESGSGREYSIVASGSEIRVPLDVFRSLQVTFKKSWVKEMLDGIKCMVEGTEVSVPHESATRYGFVFSRSEDRGGFLITPECRSDGFSFSPSEKIVAFSRFIEEGRVPAALRTKKRKPVIYEALFKTLGASTRKTATEALNEATSEYLFGRRSLSCRSPTTHQEINRPIQCRGGPFSLYRPWMEADSRRQETGEAFFSHTLRSVRSCSL